MNIESLVTHVDKLYKLEHDLHALYVALEKLIGDDPYAEATCESVAVAENYVGIARITATRYLHTASRDERSKACSAQPVNPPE